MVVIPSPYGFTQRQQDAFWKRQAKRWAREDKLRAAGKLPTPAELDLLDDVSTQT